jgi:hypothetical protein
MNRMKNHPKYLSILLTIVSAVTFVNVLVMYWFPVIIPLSSFSAVRTTVVAFIEKRYALIAVSLLICGLLFLSAISVRRQHCFLPVLSLIYLSCDFLFVLSLLAGGISDGYWKMYLMQTMIPAVLIGLLGMYCWTNLRVHRRHP